MPDLLSIYHFAVLLALGGALCTLLLNLACFRGLREAERPRPDEAPLVSILVPARNEARNIEACVRSLLAQDYPFFELLVLDDHSEDATRDILRGLGVSERGIVARLLVGEPLPAGWVGKNWACHQLARAARGVHLWFTDADTEHAPGTVSALVACARERRADLVSAWPRLVTVTWGEKLVVPMILLALALYPHWLVLLAQRFPGLAGRLPERFRRGLGAANGQSLFFTRAAYDAIGGHAALRGHLVEDLALGREVARRVGQGMRLWNCEALGFSTCRMYRSLGEVWEGFTKNVRAAFEGLLGVFLAMGAGLACCFGLPFLFALASGAHGGLVLGQVALVFTLRALLAWRFRTSWASVALHPAGLALGLAIGLNSWRHSAGAGVQWKGRRYAVEPPPRALRG